MARTRLTAGLVIGAILFSASGALADARTEAQAHFKKGMAAIADGKYEEGISELKRAYEILPHPNVLYNIARAYAESGDLEGAVAYYRKYLEGNPPDKDEVTTVVNALEGRLERQKAIAAAAQQAAPRSRRRRPGRADTRDDDPRHDRDPDGPVAIGPTASDSPRPAEPRRRRRRDQRRCRRRPRTSSKRASSPLRRGPRALSTRRTRRRSSRSRTSASPVIIQIPDLLRRLAGVDVMETTNSQTEVSMRGFNQRLSNKVLVLINGRSAFVDLLGATFWATLPIGVEDIERIEVVRGPGSALYGADAFNGVINIITKAPGDGEERRQRRRTATTTSRTAACTPSGATRSSPTALSAGFDYFPRWSSAISPEPASTSRPPRRTTAGSRARRTRSA